LVTSMSLAKLRVKAGYGMTLQEMANQCPMRSSPIRR